MYRYYGAPAVAFWEGGLPEYYFRAGDASQAQAAPAATGALTAPDWISAFTASDPQRDAQVAAAEGPNGMAKLAETPNGAVGASTASAAAAVTDGVMPAVHGTRRKRSAISPEDLEDEGELKICTSTMSNVVKKKPKVAKLVTCEVCKIQYTSVNGNRKHLRGKKHKKNLEKLHDLITPKLVEPPNGAVGASTTPAAAVADGVMPAVYRTRRKRSATSPEDLQAGAAEGELKICTMPNVVKKIPKVVLPVTCEVCKMQLTSINNIRNHETGKKHKKNLEKLQDSTMPKLAEPPNGAVGASTEPAAAVTDGVMPAVQPMENKSPAATPEDLEAGAAEGELKICTVSNVVKKIRKVVQPVTCEVCKMQLTSVNAIRCHETGKKHTRNLEKLQDLITPKLAEPPNGAVGASTAPAAAVADGVMPAVHPMENKSPVATPEDLEAGAAEGELKICTVSNVVNKIPKVVQPVTCEVYKRQFTSVGAIRDHERAKHKKNLEKLEDSITPKLAEPPNGAVGASTEPAVVTDGVMPAVHPMKRKRSATTAEDLEAKKRRATE
ncbi:hypothetical protein ACQ4PT_023895 [Festuca glaucescens]